MIVNTYASTLNLICLLLKCNLPAVYCCDCILQFNWASTTDVESNGSRATVMVMEMKLKLTFGFNFHFKFKVAFIFCC